MTERLTVAFLVLALTASLAAAQDSPSGGGDFCATAPNELLVALDGSWSLEQGAGLAVGGVPIPLPAHPPVTMQLEYDAENGYAILSGQGQQMMMVAVATETVSEVLGDWLEHFEAATEGMDACAWYALPTLVGSNVYQLTGTARGNQGILSDEAGTGFLFCVGDRTYGIGLLHSPGGPVVDVVAVDRNDLEWCSFERTVSAPGDMTMTISLKFESPSSARGMLTFMGESDGYFFNAWAPITMFR